jgi:hypothetical protein
VGGFCGGGKERKECVRGAAAPAIAPDRQLAKTVGKFALFLSLSGTPFSAIQPIDILANHDLLINLC